MRMKYQSTLECEISLQFEYLAVIFKSRLIQTILLLKDLYQTHMFENLKQHITKENLHAIKKKNRYLEESNPLDVNSNKQAQPQMIFFQNTVQKDDRFKGNDGDSVSEDSLSNYELEERQEMFNLLIEKNSPLHKQSLYFSDNKFTPLNRIKQLQRSAQLSEVKLKLSEEYHAKQISLLNQKHSRQTQHLNIEIQKLKILVEQSNLKQTRNKQLTAENKNLRELLQSYQQRYCNFQQVQKQLTKLRTQNTVFKAENNQYREILKQSQQLILNDSHLNEKERAMKEDRIWRQRENQFSLKISQQQRLISNLERRLKQNQIELKSDRNHHDEIIMSKDKRIAQLEQQLRDKEHSLSQCKMQLAKIKQQKQHLQKSLLMTMESFSKHLTNESIQNANATHYSLARNKQVEGYERGTAEISYKKYERGEQETINLDLNQSFENKKNKSEKLKKSQNLIEISPVPFSKHIRHDQKASQIQNPQIEYEPKDEKQKNQNIIHLKPRAISSYVLASDKARGKHEGQPRDTLQIPYQLQHDSVKIARLQKKLEIANRKIVQLLKQKVGKSITTK